MNLADSSRFPPSITLLGLCYTLEMGARVAGKKNPLIDEALAGVVRQQ
jgi:hypothetical protein